MWEDVLTIIKKVCQISNVIGVDINELAPIKNFDSYNSITFNMSHRKQISKWLGETKLTPMFFEMIDQVYPSNSTFYSQVLDGWLNDSPLYTSQADEDENFSIDSDLS